MVLLRGDHGDHDLYFVCQVYLPNYRPVYRGRPEPYKEPEFRFRLIRNQNDFSKFRIGDLKIRFRSIRTGLRQIKSGKKDKQINWPACAYTAVVNNIRHICVYIVYAYFECMHICIWCTCPHPGIGDDQTKLRTANPVISSNSGSG